MSQNEVTSSSTSNPRDKTSTANAPPSPKGKKKARGTSVTSNGSTGVLVRNDEPTELFLSLEASAKKFRLYLSECSIAADGTVSVLRKNVPGSEPVILDERHRDVIEKGIVTCDLLEQLVLFGRRLLKQAAKPQIDIIIRTMNDFGCVVNTYEAPVTEVKCTGCLGLKTKKVSMGRYTQDYAEKILHLHLSLLESLFLTRATIIDIQSEAIFDETMTHAEQSNRMNIIQHTLEKLDLYSETSHDEMLVNIGLLDTFACDYFQAHCGPEAQGIDGEIAQVTKKAWEMEKSMAHGPRYTSGSVRAACKERMESIMARVREVSTKKATESLAKLQAKIDTITMARAEELAAWDAVESKLKEQSEIHLLCNYRENSFKFEGTLLVKMKELVDNARRVINLNAGANISNIDVTNIVAGNVSLLAPPTPAGVKNASEKIVSGNNYEQKNQPKEEIPKEYVKGTEIVPQKTSGWGMLLCFSPPKQLAKVPNGDS